MAVDLITNRQVLRKVDRPETYADRCWGVYALNIQTQQVETLPAAAVVLATGGVGKVYRYTSNPDTATGDGIAAAWRAGCRVANMEFIQFHPTMLHTDGGRGRRTLISEAVRGEGGRLVDVDGRSVTAGVHPLGQVRHRILGGLGLLGQRLGSRLAS